MKTLSKICPETAVGMIAFGLYLCMAGLLLRIFA